MAKSIKKSYKYLIVIAGIIIVLPTILFSIIRIPEIQTLLVQRITSHLSEKINSTISVGSMEFRLFNKLIMGDILIKDRHNDTLIYAERATVAIRKIDIRKRAFTFGRILIDRPVVAFITDSTGEMNLKWYIDMIVNREDSARKQGSRIAINEIEIADGRFALVNRKGSTSRIPVDFSNLHLSGINTRLEDFVVENDTTSFTIHDLEFSESHGFTVRRMESRVKLARNDLLFQSARVNCDTSILNASHVRLIGDPVTSFSNFKEDARLDILLERSLVSAADLKYFVPFVREFNENVWLSGRVTGSVSELRGRNIDLSFGSTTRLECDFDISGLPEPESSFIYFGIDNLRTTADDIEKINIPGKSKIIVPEIVRKLGKADFNGSFTGFLSDFVAYGNLRTKEGTLNSDIALRPDQNGGYRISGLVRGSNIAIGNLTDNNEMLGRMSMKTNVDGYVYSLNNFSGDLKGLIDSIEINNYKYRNISFNGLFSEKTWDGTVTISDENIRMDVLGMFDFRNELPEFDFTLNLQKANLHRLNFDQSDSTSQLSMLVTANFRGSSIDNLDGEIRLLNSNLRKYGNNLEMYDFSIKAFVENNRPAISIRTDFADADLRGAYSFSGLGKIFRSDAASMMPSRFTPAEETGESENNEFNFSISFKNTDRINNFFRTGILLAEKSIVNGTIRSDSLLSLKGSAKTFSFRGNTMNDLTFTADYSVPELAVSIRTSSLSLLGQSDLKGFIAGIKTTPDNFIFSINWDDRETTPDKGSFTARGNFIKSNNAEGNSVLHVDIDSSDIYSGTNQWHISPSHITFDSSSVSIDRLFINNRDNYYLFDGTVSEDPEDTLRLEFRGINIALLNAVTTKKKVPDPVSLAFRGKLNGNVLLSDFYRNRLIESNITVKEFSMLQSEYGDLFITSAWNNEDKVADIRASNNLEGKKMIDISGYYDPAAKILNLNGIADKLPVDALNSLLKVFASGITGTASGRLNLSGALSGLVLRGALMAENASMKIDYLQTKYRLNDSVRFDRNKIIFRNLRLTDERGNFATLNGSVNHKYFKEYAADLMINTNESMVLNTRPKDNDLFYGTAFATGVATIKSTPGLLSFDVGVKTGKNTKFFIPLNSSETVSDYSFIKFISRDTTSAAEIPKTGIPPAVTTGIELNFDLDVTPDAEIQLIFDPKVGDIMKGHGSGNLNISLDSKGEFRISGDYIIEEGDYLFTLKNIFNKPFSVENGGKITFNGDIDNAEIDIKAIYKLKASLYEILKDEKFNERIPVECHINLTGKLFNPIVAFNIYLPMADEETRTYLKNIITTEEELSRQFLYLLVMNSFYSDPSYGTSLTSTTTTGTSAMAVTTTEMLSNQLSNWLSQISNDFDIGFTYYPGQKDLNDQEVQVALSTQLLNDRVVINGNFDVRGTGGMADNTQQLTGDFDIEYRITDKIKFKVFNRYNNPSAGKMSPYTQGFGVFFRQDFDKFSDLFRKKEKQEMKKEEEIVVQEQ